MGLTVRINNTCQFVHSILFKISRKKAIVIVCCKPIIIVFFSPATTNSSDLYVLLKVAEMIEFNYSVNKMGEKFITHFYPFFSPIST